MSDSSSRSANDDPTPKKRLKLKKMQRDATNQTLDQLDGFSPPTSMTFERQIANAYYYHLHPPLVNPVDEDQQSLPELLRGYPQSSPSRHSHFLRKDPTVEEHCAESTGYIPFGMAASPPLSPTGWEPPPPPDTNHYDRNQKAEEIEESKQRMKNQRRQGGD
ncbi:hypothetical protein BU26DRAFT_512084 [Trematosphaeria pertusa]|uniref:Uncharacterized protein n=1 Tax=Trematosphaeria pertusa TaxID=390896 RepID=A0A6A6HR89_9PLEO|nr:uncharacterized protein BU26DRAFT_512084 [Trematosphaeria pertusa]KAF2240626.1 hypothetical protein BU26DRAFT_512084 [Trematosphaeria pertusa]